jgi:phosphotransferase system IIA component
MKTLSFKQALALLVAAILVSLPAYRANAQAIVQSVTSFGSGGNSASSYNIAKPTGLAVGDLMILSVGIEGNTSVSATGFTLVTSQANSSNFTLYVFSRIADAAAVSASNFTVSFGASKKYSVGLARITGHNGTTPIGAFEEATGSSGITVTSPAITTTAANQLVLSFHCVKKAASFSGGPGTERYDVSADASSHALYSYTQVAAGSTGTKSATSSQSEAWAAIQVAINTVPASPTITASGSVTARSTTYGTASTAASFTVSGSALTGNLTVTPPAGFQTSLTEGSGYGSSTTITASGTLASTTVFVRLAAATAPGSYSGNISIAGGGATSQSVAIASSTVAAKALTVTGLTGTSKVYNRSTAASASGTAALSGVVGADAVTLTGSPAFTFASANVGTGIAITTTGYTLSGANAGNYTLTQPSLSANISAKAVSVTGLTGTDKEYDRTTAGSASGTAALSGVESPDAVSISGTPSFTFASANVGTGIAITTTGYTLAGAAAGNYTLTQPSLSANITAKQLTVTGITGANKAYTGDTIASVNGTAALSGVVSPDAVSLSGTPIFTFASANVGTGIEISTTGYTLAGAAAGNYTLIQPILSANITGKELTVTGLVGNDKEYDGLTIASASGTAALGGLTGSEQVTLVGTPTFTFTSANVGTGIAITTTGYSLEGADAANYALTQPSLAASITAKSLTISGLIGDSKVYDRSSEVTVSGEAALSGVLSPDDVTLSGSPVFVFASPNAGTNVVITATGFTIIGNNAGNYSLSQPTLSANISPKPVTITGLVGVNKVYDGTTDAATSGTAVLEGVLEPDEVNLSGTPSFRFASPKAGNAIAIDVDGYTLGGNDAANYILLDEANN